MFGIKKDTVIHFIGIGGIGMSGIARVLINLGYQVTGSDINEGDNVKKLRDMGARIHIGHKAENVKAADIIVHTSAVNIKNPEMIQAKVDDKPIIKRAEMLAELMRLKYGVAVAGTHGKTTTTSIISNIFEQAGLDPTHIVGGIVKNINTHAKLGTGEVLIAEADESDASFLLLNPIMAIVTNIDWDHLDFYGSKENLLNSFVEFINKIPFYGRVALNFDDSNITNLIQEVKKPYVSFGIRNTEAQYHARNLKHEIDGVSFEVFKRDEKLGDFKIHMWGTHNVLNSLGAIALAVEYGISVSDIQSGISSFAGVGRRLEKIENKYGLSIYDDYGHHPTEIFSTIKAVTEVTDHVVVFFEPHRYTRTRDCWKEFLHCFNPAKKVFMLPIYPASEDQIPGISSNSLVEDINKIHPEKVELIEYEKIDSTLNSLDKNAIVLTLGAGPISRKIREIAK
jgi:UDP-N-acetylmuramate--alanine ligase